MEELTETPVKRFTHQSYNQSLKEVHIPSPLSQPKFIDDIPEDESHFHASLEQWKQLNLAPSFLKFAFQVDSLSASMPLLLHNWREIVDLWLVAIDSSDDEGLRALLDLLQRMLHDLRDTLSPIYMELLGHLLKFVPRTLAAPSLTALLETFSALFRYLLIPSDEIERVERTWSAMCETLLKALPEVQRAMAEVWGSTLKKLKSSSRPIAVELICARVKGIDDFCAWIFVNACKSVSQTLHTATSSIISPLLNFYLSCNDDSAPVNNLIRRILTALIHHVKGSDHFSPIADIIVSLFTSIARSVHSVENHRPLQRILDITTVVCAVRQGTRLSQKHIASIASELINLPAAEELNQTILHLSAATLLAGDMSLWVGLGLKLVEKSFEIPLSGIELCAVLSELNWGGWKLIALPVLLKKTPILLDKEPSRAVSLLAQLQRAKKLVEVDLVWRQRLQSWVDGRLATWNKTEESVGELSNIILLAEYIPSLSQHLLRIIGNMLDIEDPKSDYEQTAANASHVLAICLHGLAKQKTSLWIGHVDVLVWTRICVKKWGWSDQVLKELAQVMRKSTGNEGQLPLDDIYLHLKHSLLSHSRDLRLSTLQLLSSKVVRSSPGEREVIKRCLQGEEISLDVQGVRERLLHISRVVQLVRAEDDQGADICARWLIAQLKVNIRPLWSATTDSLATLSQRCGEQLWQLLFAELQAIQQGYTSQILPSWMSAISDEGAADTPREEERSWRDPSAYKLNSGLSKWRLDDTRTSLIHNQRTQDRLDVRTYESQLVSTLAKCSSLAERHNRDLIPLFLSLAKPDVTKLQRHKLTDWLTLFSHFVNPKASYATATLRSLYISLLSHPDRLMQRLSLTCLLTYKSPHLSPHEDRIRALLDETRWRDELALLNLTEIEEQDRQEFVDVVVRLLFGMMLEKKGRSRGADRRAAILGTLAGCTDQELGLLVDLMLKPVRVEEPLRSEEELQPSFVLASEKQQVGFLNLLGDVLKHLGTRLLPSWPALLSTTIDIISHSQSRIDDGKAPGGEEDVIEVEEVEDLAHGTTTASKITRSIRQLGLKRFADFFRQPTDFDFEPFIKRSFAAFISPRLPSLDQENTQAPSALLELFYAWTSRVSYVQFLVMYDARIIPKVLDCLVAPNVKPAVISRIFDFVDKLLALSTTSPHIAEIVMKPHVSLLLNNLALLAERSKDAVAPASQLGQRQIGILASVAQYSTDPNQASTLMGLYSPLLRKPAKLVSEKIKIDLLKILGSLLASLPDLSDRSTKLFTGTFELFSQLFQALRSRNGRLALVTVFNQFASIEHSLQPLSQLLESLNSYSLKRMEEPDFDRRLESFEELTRELHCSLSPQDWMPVMYNMLYFIQDPLEVAIRSNASSTMRLFIDHVANGPNTEYEIIFARILFPGLKNGLRSRNEVVQTEILGVIAYSVENCTHLSYLQEMRLLLAAGDEEANFFNNINHIQIHRRSRAMRRLAEHCEGGHLRSSTLTDIFIPLVGNYITSSVDHHLVHEAITTTGRMAKQLTWGSYYALVQSFIRASRKRDESERVYVRALVSVLENFHFPMGDIVSDSKQPDDEDSDEELGEDLPQPLIQSVTPATSNAHNIARIQDAVNMRLLPNLLDHLEKRDAKAEDNVRIPVAIGIAHVAKHLPNATREPQISRLITILSQILRSRSQETRDLTRDAICRIAFTLGRLHLPLILQEMRASLLRGPQLHVLAYTAHALLVHVTSGEHAGQFSTLDNCVSDVTHVSAEVIFGESGKDVQAEEFRTKVREVRASSAKGLDSFTLLAKHITLPSISGLLAPLRAIMHETESIKTIRLVEDVLKRIANGLNTNQHFGSLDLLSLCHTLVNQNSRFLQQAPPQRKRPKKGDAIVQTKRQEGIEGGHYANNSFRFVVFGLDLFNTALRRGRFDFRDQQTMSRLESMLPVIGNTLYSTIAPVLVSGMKCTASIAKCPLKSLEKSVPVFVRQILAIVKQTGSTESDIVQTAFRSLATILRDGPSTDIKEVDLLYLLELLSPDLQEPSRQGSVFTMLRAIIARKFVVPEIYDLMDKVSEVMVTSQSPQVQELCRGALLQFLLDYPQGKGRLRNQMNFLAQNLSYTYESGRKSVMELLSAVLSKFEAGLIREYSDLLFISLVMVIANDDSSKCQEMAALLLKTLYGRLDDDKRRTVSSHLHSWASQNARIQLTRVSCQVYSLLVDVLQLESLSQAPTVLEDLITVLNTSQQALESLDASDPMDLDLEWQAPYYALTLLLKLFEVFPALPVQYDQIPWISVIAHLLFPHAWVRTAACRLLGMLFTVLPVVSPPIEHEVRFISRRGLLELARQLCTQLKSEHLDAPLGVQVVKNLFYIGKCFCFVALPPGEDSDEETTGGDDTMDVGADVGDLKERNPLPWMFSTLSYQLRSAHIARRNRSSSSPNWFQQPSSILKWFAAMASHMEASQIEPFLVHILTPVYRITEDDTIRDSHMDELKTLAIEVQDLVQTKVGTAKFSKTYNRIRQGALGLRRERKVARDTQVTTNPQAAAVRKIHRNSMKKESRKRKDRVFADNKGRIKKRRIEHNA